MGLIRRKVRLATKKKPMTLITFWVQPTRKETDFHQYYIVQLWKTTTITLEKLQRASWKVMKSTTKIPPSFTPNNAWTCLSTQTPQKRKAKGPNTREFLKSHWHMSWMHIRHLIGRFSLLRKFLVWDKQTWNVKVGLEFLFSPIDVWWTILHQ